MPRKRNHSTRSKRSLAKSKSGSREYHAPQETPVSVSSVVAQAQIPPFRAQLPYRKSFRFKLNNPVADGTNWTTSMMLDLYAVAAGGSATPCRIYNNMKLLGVKLWSTPNNVDTGSTPETDISLEFSPSTVAGFAGAPRVPYTASSNAGGKMAHICAVPKARELASQWFSAQQTVYTLFNINTNSDTVMQLDFMVTEVNGETPVSNAHVSVATKGTIGVTNFGVSGCRSIGLLNLVTP